MIDSPVQIAEGCRTIEWKSSYRCPPISTPHKSLQSQKTFELVISHLLEGLYVIRRNFLHSLVCRHTMFRLLWLRLRRCRDTWNCRHTTSDLCCDGSRLRYGRTYFLPYRTSRPCRWLHGYILCNNYHRENHMVQSQQTVHILVLC